MPGNINNIREYTHNAGLLRFLSAAAPGGRPADTPPDVEPGSDADIDRGGDSETPDPGSEAEEPSPVDAEDDPIPSGDGEQMDDNIDDLGRRPDGSEKDQPGASENNRAG